MFEITCPSGLSGVVRGLKVKDGVTLADPVLRHSGKLMTTMVEQCWLETRNPGLYQLLPGGKLDWGKVLHGDCLYGLFQIRIASLGDEYDFDVQCSSGSCQKKIPWRVRISELPVRKLSEESRAVVRDGAKFTTELPGLPKIEHRLLYGADEAWILKGIDKEPKRRGLWDVIRRIISVAGVGNVETDAKAILAWFEDLSLSDSADIRAALEEKDCGVELGFDVQCSHCGRTQEVVLPLEPSFLMKSKGSSGGEYLTEKTGSRK